LLILSSPANARQKTAIARSGSVSKVPGRPKKENMSDAIASAKARAQRTVTDVLFAIYENK
jgi:hypothetical protein